MVQAGTAAVFRTDAVGNTEATAKTANQLVEFNGGDEPDAFGSTNSLKVHLIEDVSLHPNPNKHLTNIQDGKLGTKELILRGFFKTPNSAVGILRFNNWMIQDKTNAALPFGRFGIRYDNMSQFNLTPSATVGLVLYDFEVEDVEEYQDKAVFIARFYLNGVAV
jgi:hypothetical protein